LISYVAFILAGFVCAFVSANIEYNVFADLFKKVVNPARSVYLTIPFLLVYAFETVKVFLIFMHKQYSTSKRRIYQTSRRAFFSLRIILIVISAFSTLIFTFYNLHNPEYEKKLADLKAQVELEYDRRIAKVEEVFEKERNELKEHYDSQMNRWEADRKREQKYKFQNSEEFRGTRWESANNKWNQTNNERRAVLDSLSQEKRNAIAYLENEKNIKIQTIEESLKASPDAANKMISAALQIINMDSEYPRIQYILAIGFLSLLLSVGLEAIIWSVFTVMAMNHGDSFERGIENSNNKQEYKEETEAMESMLDLASSFNKKVDKRKRRIFDKVKDLISKVKDDNGVF
jgi:hypothetical protein